MIRLHIILNHLKSFNKYLSNSNLLTFSEVFTKAFTQSILVFYNFFKSVFLPGGLAILLGILLLNYFSTNFLRALAGWLVIGFIFFWLMSGFNFFIKRYRYGKFTSAIQRFWKRTNAYFWLVEGFLFLLFFYYYINSSKEVNYMFDEASLNQSSLLSAVSFYLTSVLLLLLALYSIFILLNINAFTFKQLLVHLSIVSVFIIFIFLIECYQFYYIISSFYETTWSYLGEEGVWESTEDSVKLRIREQYFILALIAKYWHFLFIFFSWLFVVFKAYESKRLRYSLFAVNLQNLMLLFILNSLFAVQWLKWVFRRFYDSVYFWFFADFNGWTLYASASETSNFFLTMNLFIKWKVYMV